MIYYIHSKERFVDIYELGDDGLENDDNEELKTMLTMMLILLTKQAPKNVSCQT